MAKSIRTIKKFRGKKDRSKKPDTPLKQLRQQVSESQKSNQLMTPNIVAEFKRNADALLSSYRYNSETNQYTRRDNKKFSQKDQRLIKDIKALQDQIDYIGKVAQEISLHDASTIYDVIKINSAWANQRYMVHNRYAGFFMENTSEGFYVMRAGSTPTQRHEIKKNSDIKMHISIREENQLGLAMDEIHKIVSKYPRLVQEYKVCDLAQIRSQQEKSKNEIIKSYEAIAKHITMDLNEIKKNLAQNKDKFLQGFSNNVRIELEYIFDQMRKIESGNRIILEAAFTIYLKPDFLDTELESFANEVNHQLQKANIRKGNKAASDVSMEDGGFCSLTIDHIRDISLLDPNNLQHQKLIERAKKNDGPLYLEAGIPEHLALRHQLLRQHPLTSKYIIPRTPIINAYQVDTSPIRNELSQLWLAFLKNKRAENDNDFNESDDLLMSMMINAINRLDKAKIYDSKSFKEHFEKSILDLLKLYKKRPHAKLPKTFLSEATKASVYLKMIENYQSPPESMIESKQGMPPKKEAGI
jgi:hypothetical protein